MKQIFSNGLKLEVREIGEIIFEMTQKKDDIPLPIIVKEIKTDDEAREVLKNLKESGYYNSSIPTKREF